MGSTPYSKQAAANRAVQDIEMDAMPGASGSIYRDLGALNQDFIELQDGGSEPDSSYYQQALTQTQKDIRAFNTDCNSAG